MHKFVPESATAEEVLVFARAMVGKSLRDLVPAIGAVRESAASDKGMVGQLVERSFGIARNSDQAPDFRDARIELKVVPLKKSAKAVRSKERTNLTMIDFHALPRESWASAKVRKKLDRILFVFYFHRDTGDILLTKIEEVVLWTPPDELLPQLEKDWTSVKEKVAAGLAHEISEGDGRVLGAATKGAGRGQLVSQPNSTEGAKPRAWALKPSLTTWIFSQALNRTPEDSIAKMLGVAPGADFESAVLIKLSQYRGKRLGDIAASLGVPLGSAKASSALVVRRAIGVKDDQARIREFEQRGIETKLVPISPAGKVWEAMSFPKFDHMTVVTERWEDSDLLSRLERLLIVPLIREARATPKEAQLWGKPFFWSPSQSDLVGIRTEWQRYIRLIAEGHADSLPGYASTNFIHVRPHARNGSDTEEAPKVGQVVKKCFWLNPKYVSSIVSSNGGLS